MTNSRVKGRGFEQWFVNFLKELGFEAGRASYMNKYLDDNGKVDIVTNHPLHWQLKATEVSPQFHKILASMDTSKPRAILWKRNSGTGKAEKKKLVVMELDEFIKLVPKSNASKYKKAALEVSKLTVALNRLKEAEKQ